jgi:coenzyme F420-0:L-glutamate ligase/coenzyme F420-1:gamma-L-glutamate ligase
VSNIQPGQSFSVFGVPGLPMVAAGDDLATLVLDAMAANDQTLEDGDCICLAQKIVSKAEGQQIALADITATPEAEKLAAETDKDPRLVQLILDESTEVLRQKPGVLIMRHKLGLVGAHAGIDQSNIDHDGGEQALLLDSANRPWRLGTIGIAIGAAGLTVLDDHRGGADSFGRELKVTLINRADAIASMAIMVMGETTERIPVAIVRGLPLVVGDNGEQPAAMIIRPLDEDLFR